MTAHRDDDQSDDVSYRGLLSDSRLLSLTAISAVGTFGGNAVSPALPSLGAHFGVSDATVGLVMTAFTLPQIALILVVGMLADTHGRRRVLVPALLVFGLAGTAIAFVDGFTDVLWLRAVQGVVAGGIVPLTITMTGDIYEGATGSAAQGIRLSANGVSAIVVPAAAGLLAGIAWHYPFFLFTLAFPAAALGYRFLPETGGSRESSAILSELRGYVQALGAEVTDTGLGVLVVGGFLEGLAWYALLTFVPLFAVRSLEATAFAAGLAVSMRGVARIGIAPFSGLLLTVLPRRVALSGAIAVAGVGTAAVAASPNVPLLWGFVLLFGVGDSLYTPIHRDALTDLASPEHRAGVVNGMMIFRQAGATISPVAFGLVLATVGFDAVFLLAGAIYVLFAVSVLAFLPSSS